MATLNITFDIPDAIKDELIQILCAKYNFPASNANAKKALIQLMREVYAGKKEADANTSVEAAIIAAKEAHNAAMGINIT